MDSIVGFLEFVKSQIAFNERNAERYQRTPRGKGYQERAREFTSLHAFLSKLPSENTSAKNGKPVLGLRPQDLEGLPDDVLSELNISDVHKLEHRIISTIDDHGGIATLDQILVGLFKKHNEKVKRLNLNSKLYRMSQKGLIHNVHGRKGVYATRPDIDLGEAHD